MADLFDSTIPCTILSATDLRIEGGEPRVSDLRLAQALGYVQKHMMHYLVDRHRTALETFGEVPFTVNETGPKGGRPGKTYWLTKKQALYICTKSETPRATEVTIQMVEVFDAYLAAKVKTVKVKEHICQPRREKNAAGMFEPGSDIARDLSALFLSAQIAVEIGKAKDFPEALVECLSAITQKRDDASFKSRVRLLDWNWRRVDAYKPRLSAGR